MSVSRPSVLYTGRVKAIHDDIAAFVGSDYRNQSKGNKPALTGFCQMVLHQVAGSSVSSMYKDLRRRV